MGRLRLAVIGVGHLGKEHARILAGLPDVELVGVADVNAEQAQAVASRCGTRGYGDYWPLINLVDAATIVVPTTFHHAIALEFLRHGIPLLVEKPLAATLDQAEELVALASRQGTILQVGHIERFNPAFEELQRHPLQPKFVQAERLGPFTGRSTDIGAVLDLMIHDLDLLLALVGAPVRAVEAVGVSIFGKQEDVANARLVFANGCVANVTASRASAAPRRRMRIWAPEGYAGIDFARRRLTLVQPSGQLRQQRLGLYQGDADLMPRLRGESFERHIQVLEIDRNQGDQLTRELQDFIRCIRTGAKPRVGGEEARDALELATRILHSLQSHQWEGRTDGPIGPLQLPRPLGPLFPPLEGGAAA
jgi:predicted dehydrogenase